MQSDIHHTEEEGAFFAHEKHEPCDVDDTMYQLTFGNGICIKHESHIRQVLIMIYFSFTTLTTVGLGDYHPRSDAERLMVIPFLAFGVCFLSIIATNFVDITLKMKSMTEGFEDYNALH